TLPDEAATRVAGHAIGEAILEFDLAPLVIFLDGELGAGKTCLCRGILRALGHRGRVPSPTYTLVEPYELDRWSVYHVDLYRLEQATEVAELDLLELMGPGVLLLVEWPERGRDFLPPPDLEIELTVLAQGRRLRIASRTPLGSLIADRSLALRDRTPA
ncbi:MAG: tRNA (adenosine(37)-N6)-threonylcarbamoyltransferase complex ATPase subunit type 1 TsaE, partial [Xanthomonadales bacterium]|nr:tRNA (adenosine(37)-N6)-threonylcarbamoyltransferase complex ATPase subunit type 1 TsaE [Xanthomonadales bacterium]